MISYLIDGTILALLLAVGIKLYLVGRQVRLLRGYHDHYQFVLEETAAAATAIDQSIRDLNSHGAQVLLALGERVGDGHKLIGEIDERMDAVAEHYEAERTAASNVLHFAATAGKAAMRRSDERVERRAPVEPAVEDEDEFEEEPRRAPIVTRRPRQEAPQPAPTAAPRRTAPPPVEKEVKWPKLGDRFNSWRNSDADEPRQVLRPRQSR
jgi:hypothetical protein